MVSRCSWIKVLALTLAVLGIGGVGSAKAAGLERLSPLAVRAASSPWQWI